jgi:DNA-binding response OmpR family regulator
VSRILVVDDSPEFRKLMEMVLVRAGHEVVTAEDGEAGLHQAIIDSFDLILLDYMMPGMNGREVLEALRNNPNTAPVPVILITAFVTQYEADHVPTMRLGFDDLLTKPISPKDLVARVDNLLYLRRTVSPD